MQMTLSMDIQDIAINIANHPPSGGLNLKKKKKMAMKFSGKKWAVPENINLEQRIRLPLQFILWDVTEDSHWVDRS